ncbi:MAG: hypothetical protein ACFFCZ_05220 [Promethearchaeota archaeon]
MGLDDFFKHKKAIATKIKDIFSLTHSQDWFNSLEKVELYILLRDTVKRHPLFPKYLAWIKNEILPAKGKIDAETIATSLNITLGEVLIIFDEILANAQKKALGTTESI